MRADALLREGCYDCLLDAQALYADAARAPLAPAQAWMRFGIELLLAAREKELALDPAASLTRAATMAEELPARDEALRLVDLVRGLAPDPATISFRTRAGIPSRLPALPNTPDTSWLDATPLSDDVRAYLKTAARCDEPSSRGRTGEAVPDAAPLASLAPLHAYRTTICQPRKREDLYALRASAPRFVELGLFQARADMRTIQGGGSYRARTAIADTYARFPSSPAVTYLRGQIAQVNGDCRAALAAYDETVALNPDHEQALLGRTICLSYLKRPDEAIAAATTLIDGAAPSQGEAQYWRAWNKRERGDLAAARADSDRAKQLLYNTTVLTLAGMIEYDQDDLDVATRDLREAVSVGPTNCTASWYLALVKLKQKAWASSADAFSTAMTCYEQSVAETEKRKVAVLTQKDFDLDPEYVAQQVAGFDAAIAEDRAQQSASALNAAINFARARDYDRALAFADLAARDPSRVAKVEDLRAVIATARRGQVLK